MMLGHFGFSYIGLVYLLMLIVPNLVWAKRQPEGYANHSKKENKVLLAFERVGQILVVVCALAFSDYNPKSFTAWTIWLVISFFVMLVYEICWLRYFINPTSKSFYKKLIFIPVPLAVLPIFAFLLLGIYGKVIWLILSAIVFGIGHIGIHIQHLKEIINQDDNEQ